MRFRTFVGSIALWSVVAPIAHAQTASPKVWEFGMDAGIGFSHQNGASVTTISIPASTVRAGVFVTPAVSIEPGIGLFRTSSGGSALTSFELVVGALYHFETSRAKDQPYVRPFVDYLHSSASGLPSASTTGLGVGVGIKHPFNPRISGRAELNLAHYDTSPGTTKIGILAGISVFSR